MMYPSYRFFAACTVAATIALSAPITAVAQDQVQDSSAAAAAATDAPVFAAPPIDEGALAKVSGRQDRPIWQTATSSSNATVTGNKVGDNSPTGALSVSDSAFQNVSGISMVNLNTGNASSINAALNVNLTINQIPAGM